MTGAIDPGAGAGPNGRRRRDKRFWTARRRIVTALAAVVVAGGVSAYEVLGTASPAAHFVTVAARVGDVTSGISVSGTLQPVTEIGLDFGSSGIVSSVPVKPGESVKAGQVLASLDATSLESQLEEAKLAVAEDEAKLAADEAGPTPTEAAQAQASLASAEQSLTAAEASATSGTQATTAADEATAVSDAEALSSAESTLTQAENQVTEATQTLQADQAAVGSTQQSNADATQAAQDALNQASQNLSAAQVTLTDDESALSTAETLAGGTPPANDPSGVVSYYQSELATAEQVLQGCQDTVPSGGGGTGGSGGGGGVSQVNCTPDSEAVSNIQGAIAAAEKVVSDAEQVANAENAYAEAQTSLASTQDKDAAALTQANQAVAQATQALAQANDAESADDKSLQNQAAETLAAAQVAKSEACPTSASSAACTQATAAYAQASAALSQDPSGLQAAQVLAQATETKDAESLQAAEQAIASAKVALSNTKAENAALAAPAPETTIETDSDQIKSAEAQVRSLEDEVGQTRLVAPVSGVVAEVNLNVDQPASSGSSASSASASSSGSVTGDVVLEVPKTFEVVSDVSDTEIGQVKPGQKALVTVAGETTPLPATITTIQPMASSSSGVEVYPVDALITTDPPDLYAGSSATVEIVTKDVSGVLTVPTGAVHTIGTRHIVDVLRNGKEVPVSVQIGAQGTTATQIVSGITEGEQVVLAETTAALPGASTNARRPFGGGGFGPGGFGGGGFRPGGFGG